MVDYIRKKDSNGAGAATQSCTMLSFSLSRDDRAPSTCDACSYDEPEKCGRTEYFF